MPKETFGKTNTYYKQTDLNVDVVRVPDIAVSWGKTEPVLINGKAITGEDLDRLIKVLKKARKQTKPSSGIPTSRGSVRTNGQMANIVSAGSWNAVHGDWVGHWSYSGLDGSYTHITVCRTKDGSGWNVAVPTTLRVDGVTEAIKVSLAPGEIKRIALPDAWEPALKGNATIYAMGHGRDEYLNFTNDSGKLT